MKRGKMAVLGAMLLAAGALTAQAEERAPQLTVTSDILGLADTGNKTSLKKDLIYTSGPGDINLYYYNEEGQRVQYEDEESLCIPLDPVSYTGSAVLDLGDVDDALIDASGASVRLLDGNSYHADEFVLKADRLEGAWENGKYVYTLQEGDLEWNDWDYDAAADYNSDREWSIMGGDGNGVYFFTFQVEGIRYDGQEVAPATFPVSVYCYGRTVTDLSLPYEYVENTVDAAYTSGMTPTGEAQWSWYSENEDARADGKPHLNDAYTDYICLVWPEGTDASGIRLEDVTVTLRSVYGDEYVLSPETAYGEHEYTVLASGGETVIAVTYQQWALIPVYSTMEITVDHEGLTAETAYDVASVAAYMVQTGGGGVTVDHTVTCWNYYGLGGLTQENAVNTDYTLSAEIDGKTLFYCEDAEGNGYLAEGMETVNDFGRASVTAPEEAWKGDATEAYHIAVRGNVAFAETRLENTEEKEVDGQSITFTQNVSANKSIEAILADGAYLEPGFDLKGAGPLQWAWTMRYQSGWTTKSPQPTSLPYLEGAYPYGHEPGQDTEIYLQELEELNSAAAAGPGGPDGGLGGPEGEKTEGGDFDGPEGEKAEGSDFGGPEGAKAEGGDFGGPEGEKAEGGGFGGPEGEKAEGGFGQMSGAGPEEESAPAYVFDEAAFVRTEEGYSLDAADYADRWVLRTEESGFAYYILDVVYCKTPVLASAQHMMIYVPEAYLSLDEEGRAFVNPEGKTESSTGLTYTAQDAPVLIHNTSGGYSASGIEVDQEYLLGYLKEGYVAVTIQTRGKETQDEEGNYIGQFPALIVDMKAGIRFLRSNDEVLPGSSERIVSRGFSSGGAVSAMLGASGNSPVFEEGLRKIGAADAADDICVALASAPITNLSSADASYEWYQHANQQYWLFDAMAFDREGNDISGIMPVGFGNYYDLGSNILGGAHEDELSQLLYDWYVDYVQGLGFDLGDDGRSGAYYDGLTQLYADALTEFVARYEELKDEQMPATAEEYLDSLGNFCSYDPETGAVVIDSLDGVMTEFVGRNKMCPSLDSYNYRSNENNAFRDAEGNTVHFSPTVRDALRTLLDQKEEYGWTEEELSYLEVLCEDYEAGVTEESAQMLEVMSPINYIVGKEGFEGTVAPFWRLRVGSKDGDHGVPAAWLLAQGLEKYQPDVQVSVGIAWNMRHSLAELTEQDLYAYIADCMQQ